MRGWVTYEEAKELTRKRGIKSSSHFKKWYDETKPKWIPRNPDKCYKEWEGWGTFLGTGAVFGPYQQQNKVDKYISYWEATRIVQQLNLNGCQDYFKWWRDNRPEHLPRWPEYWFGKLGVWQGWDHFLGKSAIAKLDKTEENVAVFAIVKNSSLPFNVFTFIMEQDGQFTLGKKIAENKWQLVKCFKWNKERVANINSILSEHSSSYYGEKMVRIIPNIHQLIWELSDVLDVI